MVALFVAGILDEFTRHRNLAGLFRHTATLQIWLVNAIRADLLHGHGFFAVQIDGHGLRPFALHFRNTGNLTERGNIVIGQSGRRQHLNIVQSLGVEKTICRKKSVSAARVNAGKHGNAQQRDQCDGDESLPRMQPHTHHVFDECHDDLQPRSVQAHLPLLSKPSFYWTITLLNTMKPNPRATATIREDAPCQKL